MFSLNNCGIERAFLFDVVSKIYIATDCSPFDMQSYEFCCDMIDVVIDLSTSSKSQGNITGLGYTLFLKLVEKK
uniref:Uncharacterized protein n=1 Tax=Glossina palpalis gambiensis TaxID=67801 RepID=A0A1B0C078_9MUSC